MSPCSQKNRKNPSGLRSKITKKDSRSVGDLRDTTASGHYMWTFYDLSIFHTWQISRKLSIEAAVNEFVGSNNVPVFIKNVR